ncbi:MAG: metal ABC transporter permease [Candidatus Thiodiazotropha lotti]|uniref:Zinc/manganese transporter permease n=1 Tax=Candidatus Thiodiazotropha endoloripes TaxID=1818881 RepID=A0A1E2UTN8_9GAMM|nr:metal ABC transporter permease [Candidatus Thiodiazotropha endoloripes]MCG7900439.1 metal ABC transporter permease [Candidatus Thiodiazotropha weberae]MCG7990984.1 metal ABC transporter permease [Candidatus Thiodiazotropha lotti]MCG7903026.1 metal ABC transporter permease [Candidatus Thiodiazotropha weberae]MCG7914571.1 metal ABC transporter permease [Candidatus Thiodiazotropha weberae]MCG8001033.1 metal ABC transporter permease [Candidatus Thiodiazotropha lotti]
MNWQLLDPELLLPAFLAGLLVASTHVPLGRQVLQRGIIFLDLAVAQTAAMGLIAAYSFGWEPGGWQVQLIAVMAAVSASLLLHITEQRWGEIQEALIGTLFVLTSSGSILLLAANPHGGEHLKEMLVGQILWVDYQQLLPVALLYAVVLLLWYGLQQRSSSLLFYLLFAIAITASVQLIGVYLVFATLIMPALALRRAGRWGDGIGYLIAAFGYGLGLIAAALLDMPAGAMIVYTLAVTTLVAGWLVRKREHSFDS